MGTDDDGAATEADGSVPPEASSGKSAAQISDMRQFFMTEGADYDLWCLPDVHAIMAVPEKDKDIAFSEEGLQMRYHTLSALTFLLRVLHLRHTLLLADAQASTDPVCVTRGVVEEMKQVRKQTQDLGSGSLPNQCVLYIINQSSCVWLTFLFSIGEWRDCLRRRRRASAETVAGQMLQLFQSNDSQNHADHSVATEQLPQRAPQPFGTEGITTRGMQAIDDVSKMALLARQCAELDRQIFSDVKQKVASAIDTAVQGISQKQVDKHCLAVLDFVSTACAADQMKTAFIHRKGRLGDASPHTTYDKMVSAIGAGLDPTQTKMRQIKVAANEIGRDMLQSEGQELRRMYNQLTTKAIAGIPTTVQWPRVQDRFRAKLDIVSKALEAIKLKSEHEPNEEGETDLKITETMLDSIMDGLGRDLRTWAENEIAAARRAERADAADVEHLLHRQENQTLYAQHALELQKKSFARRVEAEIIDRNYQQLLDNDRLRRALRLERKKLAEHEPSIRAKVRVEYDKLVTDLVAELAKSNARFKDFQLQLTQGTLHNLNELKRSTINSMENHHATPNAFKKSAALIQAQIVEDDDIQQQNSEAQRAVLKIKSLYQMKVMKLHQEHKAKMRELEAQEQLRKESVGEGRESLEEKITLLQEQLDKTRDLVSTTEIELKNCRAELQLSSRSKNKLLQWKMSAKKRISDLEAAGADMHAASRQVDKLKADADKQHRAIEGLLGIEQRAEQRNAAVEFKTAKQLQRMRSTLRREQSLKLKAYARLEEVISDVSLGQVVSANASSDVWIGRYQAARRALESTLRQKDQLVDMLLASGHTVPDVLLDELDQGPGAETTSSFPGSETTSSLDSLLATGSRGGHKTRHASTTGAHMLQPLPQMGRERRSHSRSSFIGGDRRRSKDGILS